MATPLMSPHRMGVQSAHRQLKSGVGPFSLSWDLLQNVKFWPGTLGHWLNERGGMNASIMKSVTDRQNFRKRYGNAEFQVIAGTDLGSSVSSESWGLTGAGSLPVATYSPSGPTSDPIGFVDVGHALNVYFPGFWGDTHAPAYTASYSGVGRKGYIQAAGPRPDMDQASVGLSGEVKFKDHLQMATDRVKARTWPTFHWPSNNYEYYGEYQGWSNLDPANNSRPLDGAWHLAGGTYLGPGSTGRPYFGAATPHGSGEGAFIWTGWIWATQMEETTLFVDTPYATPILAQRARFRCSQALPYFIARATINRVAGFGPVLGATNYADCADSLWNVRLLFQGITIPNALYEVGWPAGVEGETDFTTSFLWTYGANTLSIGACCFAVVGETPEAWRARTGFVLNSF